ncbi:MAG: AraC family transcriptional regulator [Alphaproteobacteria bacterium]|nr:MAG: AraC family transcriptional regulator [Alphaproteobacteria bacterium]
MNSEHNKRGGKAIQIPEAGQTVNLSERFALSGRFKQLFADGMSLVEQSANYLDGPGRQAARELSRQAALIYGTESMRLTTRLMQLASWLLLQRAANEGELTRDQVIEEKKKVRLETLPRSADGQGWDALPPAFVELVTRSLTLQNRILTLDQEIYGIREAGPEANENPVDQQINLLSTALGAMRKD